MAVNLNHFSPAPKFSGVATSELIRDVALRLFVQHGYQSVSLRQIAEEVGINAGSLYHHIESKAELLYELVERYELTLTDEVLPPPGKRNSAVADMLRYVRSYITHVTANTELACLSQREFCCLSADQKKVILTTQKKNTEYLIETLQAGSRKDQFKIADIQLAAQSVLAILDRVAINPTNRGASTETITRHIQCIVLKAIGASNS